MRNKIDSREIYLALCGKCKPDLVKFATQFTTKKARKAEFLRLLKNCPIEHIEAQARCKMPETAFFVKVRKKYV
jgi:hypothetical protein